MSCTLYAQFGQPSAPDREDAPEIRIVKTCIAERDIECDFVDAKRQREVFNRFYRCHKPEIRRSEAGIRFPVFFDGMTVRQGVVPILAYVLSGYGLEGCVADEVADGGTVGGLFPSRCPADQEGHFHELVDRIVRGGCRAHLLTEGTGARLLGKLLGIGEGTQVSLAVPMAENAEGEDFAATVGLVCAHPGARLLVRPVGYGSDGARWPSERTVAEAVSRVGGVGPGTVPPLAFADPSELGWDVPPADRRYVAACARACGDLPGGIDA
ncbi:MAG: hypothetical protein LBR22_01165 [Desulfovibrio sp.]|jgi:pyruvate formate lyase activating enzyme|nr:hypothetical protein [Desulfovibrio sp.]